MIVGAGLNVSDQAIQQIEIIDVVIAFSKEIGPVCVPAMLCSYLGELYGMMAQLPSCNMSCAQSKHLCFLNRY